jgi:hypothetical protein
MGLFQVGRLGCNSPRGIRAAILVCLAATGCWSSEPPTPNEQPAVVSYSLFLSRGSLTSNDFEQYRSLPEGLFAECGDVQRGRAHTSYQGIEPIQPETTSAIAAKAQEVIEQLKADEPPLFDAPGTGTGFTDPGKFTLLLGVEGNRHEVRTSLDWVEQQHTLFAKRLNTLTQLIRGVPARALCGNGEFYGVGREPRE